MSRIGRSPIPLPQGVQVSIDGARVSVKGSRGQLSQAFSPEMKIKQEGGVLTVARPSDAVQHRALHGLTRALLNNMVVGVSEGFTKSLELQGVGYRVAQEGSGITLQVGFSHSVPVEPPEGVQFRVEGNNRIHVDGSDKQVVGEAAARLRAIRPPNVYTGKGLRYLGEQVRRKAGKAGGRKR